MADHDVKIRIDRSDAKITVTGIRIDACTVHGRWTIPNLSGAVEGPEASGDQQ